MLLPPRALTQEREWDGEETLSYFATEVAETSDESPRQRQKRRVNWTLALKELVGKQRRGRDLQ